MARQPSVKKYLKGLLVYDAKQDSYVIVMFKDIKGACPWNPCNCAIARALKRSGYEEAVVTPYRIYVREPGKNYWIRFVNHEPVSSVIQTFDTTGRFTEGRLRLCAPRGIDMLGQRHNPPTRPDKRGTRSRQNITIPKRVLPRISDTPLISSR